MLLIAAAAGCYTGPNLSAGASPSTSVAPTAPAASGDLPCDVADLLTTSCSSCHGEPLSGGAKNRLLDAADLAAPSKIDPSKTIADDCIQRMKDASKPMPPTGALADDRIAVLEAWVAGGMPKGACETTNGSTPTVCTSGTMWTRGDHGSKSMHPGKACIACHSTTEEDDAPIYSIAGTVYPTAHEPDDCYGATSGATVVITDAKGASHSLAINSAGNFYTRSAIATPYTAKVIAGGKTRVMETPQTEGDCNSCHTERGASDAPGRIMTP